MKVQDLLRAQYRQAGETLEAVIGDCEDAALNWVGDKSTIGSIRAIYGHTVYDIDQMLNGPLGRPTVYDSGGWADRTGWNIPGPMQTEDWAKGARYDMAAVRDYAKAVYAAVDDYLAQASDDEISAEVETFGGKQPLGQFLGTIGLWHVSSHQGEISALKGVQGLKGLPF